MRSKSTVLLRSLPNPIARLTVSKATIHAIAAATLVTILITSIIPLRTASEIGGDEGFEFIKGFSLYSGINMYRDMWNDQPPLFAWLIAIAFHFTGPSALVCRLITVAFSFVLNYCLFSLTSRGTHLWAGWLAVAALTVSPMVLALSASAMVELPAFAITLLSVLLLTKAIRNDSPILWFGSGMTLGFAVMTKLVVLLVAPAMCIEAGIWLYEGCRGAPSFRAFRMPLLFVIGFITSIAIVCVRFPGMTLHGLLESHASGLTRLTLRGPKYSLDPALFFQHLDATLPALMGIVLLSVNQRFQIIRFPAITFVVMLCVHSLHHPWWAFYYLHFSIMLAWLGALGIVDLFTNGVRVAEDGAPKVIWQWLFLASLTVSLLLTLGGARLVREISAIDFVSPISRSEVTTYLRAHSTPGDKIYTRELAIAFHARLLLPPPLAIIPLKRTVAHLLTSDGILEELRRSQPRWLLLPRSEEYDSNWRRYLDGYALVSTEDPLVLLERRDSK